METRIRKYLEGKATEKEVLSLLQWVDDQDNFIEFKRIKGDWKANSDLQNIPPDTLLELDKFKSKILKETTGKFLTMRFMQKFYKYAAILLLVVSVGSIYLLNNGKSEDQSIYFNTIMAENGQISKAMLPDSTVVWLNSGSSLKYNNQFGIDNRDIELKGQAYFDVTKNKNLPLVIACDEINVRVLGTQFTAETYPDYHEINVVLIEGSVELRSKNSKKAFAKLQPNEMMVYSKQDNKFEVSEVVTERYTSWREGIIHIYDQPLKEVVIKLQKRYNQQIIVEKELEDYRVTFSIRNEEFKDVMDLLLAITPAKADQKGELIYLKKN